MINKKTHNKHNTKNSAHRTRTPSGKAAQKHPSSGKSGARKQSNARPKLINIDLTPFILLAVTLILETCFLLAEQSGAAGMAIKKLFFGLFGSAMYIVPMAFLLLALFWRDIKRMGTLRYKLIMLSVSSLLLTVSATLVGQDGLDGAKFDFTQFWVSGTLSESGGVFGGFFGFILSRLFTPTVAAVLTVIALIVTATFSFGKTRLGLWRIFIREKSGEESAAAPARTELKAKLPPTVGAINESVTITAPRRIDTVINPADDDEELAQITPPALTRAEHQPFADEMNDTFLDAPVSSDGVRSDGTLADIDELDYDDEGFSTEQNLRANYRPADLMEDLGLRVEQAEKHDIYSEEPSAPKVTPLSDPYAEQKATPVAPATPKTEEPQFSSTAYSPFATILSRDEFFEQQKAGAKGTSQKKSGYSSSSQSKSSGEPHAFSPFADPLASMNAPKRDTENTPPQSIIAMGLTEEWEEMQKEQAKQLMDEQSAMEAARSDENSGIKRPDTPEPPAHTSFEPAAPAYSVPVTEQAPSYSAPVTEQTPVYAQNTQAPVFDTSAAFPKSAPSTPAFAPASTPAAEQKLTDNPIFGTTVSAPKIGMGYGDYPTAPQTTAPATPKMPTESKYSAFDDDIVAPERADETPAPVNEEPERNPAAINPFSRYTKLRYPRYKKPPTDLLEVQDDSKKISEAEIHETMKKILDKLESFHVDASVTGYSAGPSITRYEVTPGPGVKVKQITNLAEDIGLAVQSEKIKSGVRIVTVPGKSVIGIEVPNSVVSKVSLRSLIENPDFQKAKSKITVCVGLTVSGKPVFMNIDDMPHVLVAGQTKSGKSVAINAMIMSIIYRASPDEVQFILVDPKQVELSIYNDIPHMVMPVIDDPKRAAGALQWAVAEMERRYTLIKKARVRDREEYYRFRDQNPDFEYMPQIVIIIDELADLMLQQREHVEEPINRLAAKARACGMNLIIGTQRPSTDIVTGLIKANIPSKISFRVASPVDSRVILGNVGAEKLLGRGDMLYHPTGGNQTRAQGAFVDTPEIKRVLDYIIDNNGPAEFDPEILYKVQSETDKINKTDKKSIIDSDDYAVDTSDIDFDYLCQATELVINLGKATTNVIQRHLKVGFNRASNIVDKLEELNFISKSNGSSKPRDVLISMQDYLEWKNANQR